MERATEMFAALCFLGIGLSHILQPHVWVEFFVMLRGNGRAGMFVEGFLCLWFGAVIVAFHNVWTGLPIILTLIGWAQIVKGFVRFVAPQLSLRVYQRVAPERAWLFRVGGVAALALGGFLGYLALYQ